MDKIKPCITREEVIDHIQEHLNRPELDLEISRVVVGKPKRPNLLMRVILYLPNLYKKWRYNRDLEIWVNTPKICDMCVGNFTWGELYACSGDAWLCGPCLDKYMHDCSGKYPVLEITSGPN